MPATAAACAAGGAQRDQVPRPGTGGTERPALVCALTPALTRPVPKGYTKLLHVLGSNVAEFLQNLNNLHLHLSMGWPAMVAPAFRCEEVRHVDGVRAGGCRNACLRAAWHLSMAAHTMLVRCRPATTPPLAPAAAPVGISSLQVTPESLLLHYYSSRPGLWPIVVGVLKGMSKEFFGFEVGVELVESRDEGAHHEVFRLTYPYQETLRHYGGGGADAALASYAMPPALFYRLFPFHLLLAEDLTVLQAGPQVKRIAPSLAPGDRFVRHFKVRTRRAAACLGAAASRLLQLCNRLRPLSCAAPDAVQTPELGSPLRPHNMLRLPPAAGAPPVRDARLRQPGQQRQHLFPATGARGDAYAEGPDGAGHAAWRGRRRGAPRAVIPGEPALQQPAGHAGAPPCRSGPTSALP